MSAMRPPRAPDSKYPRHPREDLHRFINDELNVKYNLGVPILPPDLSPSERREQETAATRLYIRLEVHFYQGGLEALQQLTKEFDLETRHSCSQWVKKPRADPDTLPVSGNGPLASNQAQRDCLQSIFHKVLDRVKPKRIFSRTQSGPAAFSMEKSTSVQSKRAAEDEMTKSPIKRSKLVEQAVSAAQVPSPATLSEPRHLFAAQENASDRHQQGSNRTERSRQESFEALRRSTTYSTSTTSESSSHAVFSHAKIDSSTQETVEASSQEQRRTLPTSQDQFQPTSTMEDVLHKSFDDYETSKTANQAQGERAVAQALPTPPSGSILGPHIWPTSPDWLRPAPFHVAWEVLRIGAHMRVNLNSARLAYSPQWTDQKILRGTLSEAFRDKSLPAAPDPDAWAMANGGTSDKHSHVVFTASLEFSSTNSENPLQLRLQPLKLDKPHRLGRKYGADRFLELLVPSPDSSNLPWSMKDKPFYDELVNWLTQDPHAFCGRHYRSFYLKSGGQRKPLRYLQFGPEPKPVYTDRVYLFAENGSDIAKDQKQSVPVESMISWALELEGGRNDSQPVLKLFQRLALVLSKTTPTVAFEPHQIRHRSKDLRSTDGKKVMNDGVGQMSRRVAKLVQTVLGLSSPPCAVQGRLGSAKGMWIIDVADTTDEIWIETYPSQRKWNLRKDADQEHRTLEIRSWTPEKLRSASLNLQFLPVLEDRAIDKQAMRDTISKLLDQNLRQELDDQRQALNSPIQFQKWISANSAHRSDRISRGHVPFQGGLPRENEEIMAFLLNAGFDPWQNRFLNQMAYDAQFQMCEKLKKKLNIKIGCSASLFMLVDFHGQLEEGEVHIAFSDRFRADAGDWEGIMVHGVDVLVARSPAHFPSDIQRVKAVFRPGLAQLQNVIVFSAKGKTSLAEKLSGGDYDGDIAFVCWDDRVVKNFDNANDEVQPDLRSYYRQDQIKLRQLLSTHNEEYRPAIEEMIEKCFAFNLTKDMLGQATNYKERLCYFRGNVHDEVAMKLSALLSTLVDAPKQGIEFDAKDFKAFKQSLKIPDHVDEPLYKMERQPPRQRYTHILDHLKFAIAQPAIKQELSKFYAEMNADDVPSWDKDLTARHYDEWNDEETILRCLKQDIKLVLNEWNALLSDDTVSFAEMVQRTYNSWQGIQPSRDVPEETLRRLRHGYAQTSEWALLKASTTFKLYYQLRPHFVWQLAGWHLCFIKWQAITETPATAGRMPAMLTSPMHAITKVDSRVVNHLVVNHLVELQTDLGTEGNENGDEEDDV